ncbi:MAG: GNAT family N-acetyltransferase [Myxococcales bacterium]|nr:GNAT family N-acetyltransferase [Myxococcales bacterium]MCB9714879.1 GNAT family N-acetyltransferase [Myxococcales bacterium]
MLVLPQLTTGHVVRPALRSELPALAAIRRESWWATYRDLLPEAELRGMDDRRTAARMASVLGSPLQQLLVAVDGRGVVRGYAWVGPHREGMPGHHGEVYELYLHPAAQGRGLGRQLLVEGIWWLVERGLHPVLVWVLAANPARHFYAACGGERVARGPVKVAGRELQRLAYSWRGGLPLPG